VKEAGVGVLVLQVLRARGAGSVLMGMDGLLARFNLAQRLETAGIRVVPAGAELSKDWRAPYFGAEAGISCADYLIAETGTAVIKARPGEPRSVSLLPPLHLVIA